MLVNYNGTEPGYAPRFKCRLTPGTNDTEKLGLTEDVVKRMLACGLVTEVKAGAGSFTRPDGKGRARAERK